MLEFIIDHYLISMVVAVFFIFALIGYIVDNLRNKKREAKVEEILEVRDETPEEISEPALEESLEPEEENIEEEQEVIVDMIPEVEEIQDNK